MGLQMTGLIILSFKRRAMLRRLDRFFEQFARLEIHRLRGRIILPLKMEGIAGGFARADRRSASSGSGGGAGGVLSSAHWRKCAAARASISAERSR